MGDVRTSAIGSTTFITHSIFVQALRQVSWRFIVFITLLASQRAPSADKISDDGAPASRRPAVKGKRGFEIEATSVGIRIEGLSALTIKSRETGWLGPPSPLVRTTVMSIGGEFS